MLSHARSIENPTRGEPSDTQATLRPLGSRVFLGKNKQDGGALGEGIVRGKIPGEKQRRLICV